MWIHIYRKIYNNYIIANCLQSVPVKECSKSVNNWHRHGQKESGTFFIGARCIQQDVSRSNQLFWRNFSIWLWLDTEQYWQKTRLSNFLSWILRMSQITVATITKGNVVFSNRCNWEITATTSDLKLGLKIPVHLWRTLFHWSNTVRLKHGWQVKVHSGHCIDLRRCFNSPQNTANQSRKVQQSNHMQSLLPAI